MAGPTKLARRVLRRLLMPLALLLLVLSTVLGGLLGSHAGSRWLLNQVPGLQVEGLRGRLGDSWSAEQVRWQQDDTSVQLDALRLSWSPSCLLRMTLCIEQLQTSQVRVHLPPSTQASSAPVSLPELALPLAVQLAAVRIDSLSVNDLEQLHGLQLAADWSASGLQIERLSLGTGALALELHGLLQTTGHWPLQLSGQLQLPAPEQQGWQLAWQISGELQNQLQITADSSGYLQGQLTGTLQPLAEHLPAQLQLQVARFKASAQLPDSLALEHLTLNANGDLQAGYQLSGNANLAAKEGPIAVTLAALVHAEGAAISRLQLTATPQQQLQLSAQVNWLEDFSLDSRFAWQDFPWQRLYPLASELPVRLQRLNGQLSLSGSDYHGQFAADLQGPSGAFSLHSPFKGNFQHVALPALQLRAGQGRADGQLSLGFAGPLNWDVQLQLSAFDPAYWLAELPGKLAGRINSSGTLVETTLTLNADLDLRGRLRGQPAHLQGKFAGGLDHGQLSELNLRLGDNQISGQLALQQQLSGQIKLAMPRLSQLWPHLQGQLNGQLSLAGSVQAPHGKLQLNGQQLAYLDNSLQRFSVSADLNSAQRGQLSLDAQAIKLGATELGQLTANAAGDLRQQSLELQLQGPLVQSQLAFAGGLTQGNWRGTLTRAYVQGAGQHWQLQHPASLTRLANGQLNWGAHCWFSAAASLCADEQRLWPEPSLRLHLNNLPLDSLAQWLPQDLRWHGQLNGQVQLDLPASGPSGQIVLDAGSGTWQVRQQEHWFDFSYDSLRLSSQLRPQRVDSSLLLRGEKLGELSLVTQLDPRQADKPLTGSYQLSGLNLAVVGAFLPMFEHISGTLHGAGNLAGSLLAPQINGDLQLRDGALSGPQLPLEIADLHLKAQLNGEHLALAGGWRSGQQGLGNVHGELDWQHALSADLYLSGNLLPINIVPFAELEVEPDLHLRLRDERLSLAGKVAIPSGAIAIHELPPSVVQVSNDAVIVGSDERHRRPPEIAMDIAVEVGQKRLTFNGFGLSAVLAGRVHIGNNLDTRGNLSLNEGRFRAYGQRLTIRRAHLMFTGAIDQPTLDIEAIRRTDAVTAGIRLSGNAKQPQAVVFSEPAMSQEQALSYLVLGRPPDQASSNNAMLAQAALSMGMSGSAPLLGDMAQQLGVSDFQIDTQGSGATSSVVASGSLTDRLSVRYGAGIFEPSNVLVLRYALTRTLYVEAAGGFASALDLFYRRNF
jgi:translocation and assembly module TamB